MLKHFALKEAPFETSHPVPLMSCHVIAGMTYSLFPYQYVPTDLAKSMSYKVTHHTGYFTYYLCSIMSPCAVEGGRMAYAGKG